MSKKLALKDLKGLDIYNTINTSKELEDLEIKGFLRGEKAGKTTNVPIGVIYESLSKQVKDLQDAYQFYQINSSQKEELKQKIADLRNVAGCLFLKLQEVRE